MPRRGTSRLAPFCVVLLRAFVYKSVFLLAFHSAGPLVKREPPPNMHPGAQSAPVAYRAEAGFCVGRQEHCIGNAAGYLLSDGRCVWDIGSLHAVLKNEARMFWRCWITGPVGLWLRARLAAKTPNRGCACVLAVVYIILIVGHLCGCGLVSPAKPQTKGWQCDLRPGRLRAQAPPPLEVLEEGPPRH